GPAMRAALFAQAAGTPGGATTGGGRGTPTGPTAPTPGNTGRLPTTTNPNQTQFPDTVQRPLYISGKVVLDDGTPPPDPVVMQLVCSASPRSIGYTDSKG